jgi:hypothetical protein
MQLALEGGTETGSMLVFDPMSLPPEIDRRQRRPRRILEDLGKSGALYRIPRNGEGWFTLRVFLNEPLPRSLEGFASLVDSGKPICVKDGTLFFTGGEYAFHRDDALLCEYPSMGEHGSVPAGDYLLSLYALSYPEGFHEGLLEERTTREDHRVWSMAHGMGFVHAFLPVFLVFLIFVLPWPHSVMFVLPTAIAAIIATWLLARDRACRRTDELKKGVRREFSDYAMLLTPVGATGELEYVI